MCPRNHQIIKAFSKCPSFISTSPSNTCQTKNSCVQTSRYLMGYVLSCLFNRELIRTSHHLSLQLTESRTPHLQASLTITVANSQKTDPLNMGQNLHCATIRPQLRQYHFLWEETCIQTCIQMFCHWLSNSFQCYLGPP